MTDMELAEEIERLAVLSEKATQGPWAWDQRGEKINEWALGTAFRRDETPIVGRFTDEDALYDEFVCSHEAATCNYSDPEFICALVNWFRANIAALRRGHERPPSGEMDLATAYALAQTEIKGHVRVQDELKARIKKLEWDHYHAWAPMFSRLMMVCHRLENGLPIKLEEVQGWGNEHPAPQAQACIAELEKDAARYRWLRAQDWDAGPLFVVKQPTEVRLGTDCPSRDRLDEAIDAALKSRA